MDDLQTDTLSDYAKNQNLESSKDSENPVSNLLNGCEEIDDPLDLMDHCENASIGSNSDVWKGSDSEDESFDNKDNPQETSASNKSVMDNMLPKLSDMSEDNNVESDSVEGKNSKDKVNTELALENNSVVENKDASLQSTNAETSEENTNHQESMNLQENANSQETTTSQEEVSPQENDSESTQDTVIENNEEKEPPPNDINKDNPPNETVESETQEKDSASGVDNQKTADHTVKNNEEKTTETDKPEEKEILGEDRSVSNSVSGDPASLTEKDPTPADIATVTEKDPLADDGVSATEKDPLTDAVASTENDPLANDVAERDYSREGVIEKNVEARRPDRNFEEQDDDESQMDYNDDDDDFDPSLLCPEVSMAVDDNPVITSNGPMPNDGNPSPLPYEPLFSTFVDEVTGAEISFNLTSEEQELRRRLYGPTNPIQTSRIHCTACNVHLGSALEGQNNRFVHPLLKVLICKECYHFYTSGEFEKDEDGSELYCRWCGQGGRVLCCSKCEYVFCKRCIRTNFGRKKMFEIRDSDSWDCFRCVPSQIITQRIACYEFFEFVRREMSRASSGNNSEAWCTDYTRCCSGKKKSLENGEEVKKPKKKKLEIDPDYNPLVDKAIVLPTSPVTSPSSMSSIPNKPIAAMKSIVLPPKSVQIMSRFNKPKDNDIEFVRHIPAPQMSINPVRAAGYRAILPAHVRPVMQPPTFVRIGPQHLPPLIPTGGRLLNNALQARNINTPNMMKHEWFEKTVRAAARVNSHLSYTLTQLNKAQSQAASVEELAVVHNKLQEILSSSINSLIQIRKNLRTEFIAGIKTVRLPSKKVDSFSNDDDVIFVSAPSTMSMPSTSQAKNVPDPIVIVDSSNKSASQSSSSANNTSSSANPTETVPSTIERPRTYLKVKSVSELQNVPAECITIPDDAPAPSPSPKQVTPPVENICNGVSNTQTPSKDTPDPQSKSENTLETQNKTPESSKKVEPPAKKMKLEANEQIRETRTRRSKDNRTNKVAYNIKEQPSPEVKKMMSVTVNLLKVDLEKLQKQLPNECH